LAWDLGQALLAAVARLQPDAHSHMAVLWSVAVLGLGFELPLVVEAVLLVVRHIDTGYDGLWVELDGLLRTLLAGGGADRAAAAAPACSAGEAEASPMPAPAPVGPDSDSDSDAEWLEQGWILGGAAPHV
jgi:hypothetical protein